MDCYNWRNCEADCDHCEVTNMDIAQAVQGWSDPDYLVQSWPPEEILSVLRHLGKRAEQAEGWIDSFKNAAEYWRTTALRLEKERDVAREELSELRVVLKHADDFISNGIELGYIRKPEPGTPEDKTADMVRNAAWPGGK